MSSRGVRNTLLAAILPLVLLTAPATATRADRSGSGDLPDWIDVVYAELVDRRQPSHSGASVGAILDELAGRALPPKGERVADRVSHSLLDPLLEPYAFVLPDLLDSLGPVHDPPYVDIGSLWRPGAKQPVWVELLRARRYVVASDGEGNLRAILPATGESVDSRAAAAAAWASAWPVLRHVVAAEQRRLAQEKDGPTMIAVQVFAYAHAPQLLTFRLGTHPETITMADTRPDGLRPPLRLGRIAAFLEAGLLLEGARIDDDGNLHLLGSKSGTRPSLLGRPLSLADLAVAYRAVFHGGLGAPYMSLDRGYSPQNFIVNYGGRLRDTAMGMVSLLCDIRFKTFSVGLDIVRGEDLRRRLRGDLGEFYSHLERFAAHPDSQRLAGQQTRLWFYPDAVDLTLSPEGDIFVMRQVRMSAASERMQEGGLHAQQAAEHPWTKATVDAINRDYDELSRFFPEMADLDQVARLLSLFAWLQQAGAEGRLLPELDTLLAIELPQLTTPRNYPQLLAFNALPDAGSTDPVGVFDRVDVSEALDRLGPLSGRPFAPWRRYQRAIAALDPQQPDHAAILAELENDAVENLGADGLDLLAHRAERVRMHQLVLATLGGDAREDVANRLRAGEELRIFSVGIGGLDLDMGQALDRARGRQAGPADAAGESTVSRTGEPRQEWRKDSGRLPPTMLPAHGLGASTKNRPARQVHGDRIVEVGRLPNAGAAGRAGWILTVDGESGPEVRSRRLELDARGRAVSFERIESTGIVRYRFDRRGDTWTAKLDRDETAGRVAVTPDVALPPGLLTLRIVPPDVSPLESRSITLQLARDVEGTTRTMEAELPRRLLQRLVLGRTVDLGQGQPLSGLAPLPSSLGEIATMIVMPDESRWKPPWQVDPALLAGEEDPIRVARALKKWWAADGSTAPAAAIGVDALRSPDRWSAAPMPGTGALLFLPEGAFLGSADDLRGRLADAWSATRVVRKLPARIDDTLVVVVSDEPPGTFGDRLRRLSRDARLEGKLLAAWCLSGPVRADLPGPLLAEGRLAGFGLAEPSVVLQRRAEEEIAAMQIALAGSTDAPTRVERLPGPFLWYF